MGGGLAFQNGFQNRTSKNRRFFVFDLAYFYFCFFVLFFVLVDRHAYGPRLKFVSKAGPQGYKRSPKLIELMSPAQGEPGSGARGSQGEPGGAQLRRGQGEPGSGGERRGARRSQGEPGGARRGQGGPGGLLQEQPPKRWGPPDEAPRNHISRCVFDFFKFGLFSGTNF